MNRLIILGGLCLALPLVRAQDAPTPLAEPPATSANPAGPSGSGTRGSTNEPPLRSYDQVITKDAKTTRGVFAVHQVGTRYYYEIPRAMLGKDFLLVTRIARNSIGSGYEGQDIGSLPVRWELRANRVLLREVTYQITADPADPIAKAVEAASNPSIILSFNVETLGPGGAPVIEVTRMFNTEVPEFSPRTVLRARAIDPSRSFVERVTAFPENIEAEATHTYTLSPDQGPGAGRGGIVRPATGTVLVHFSMVKLPEKPMTPRLFDARVGFFTNSTLDYSSPEHRAERHRFIARWRLEKKDPHAPVSEPVKPIVFYLDPGTPKKWMPYLKRGIESWQPALESAGFKNAIVVKQAPTPEEDPTWSAEDIRYSVVRWQPSTSENADAPHISDPRTGEILNAEIEVHHNVMQMIEDWYFIQAGPLDPRARTLPLPDDLMGDLLSYVVAHEAGHTLGLEHNMKASSLYPVEKLHDPAWLKTMGHTPSIMDEARFNYVAQPEDHIDPQDLIPKVGPYDRWAIHWAYAPIAGQESKILDQWAREQDQTPWLRFSTDHAANSDPGDNYDAVGDADAISSTAFGLKNLQRVLEHLLAATTRPGDDWDDLRRVYERVVRQWTTELGHVVQIVGGVDSQEKLGGQEGVQFTPVSKLRQAAAVKFLNENAFATPTLLLRPEILRQIEPSGALTRIRDAQWEILSKLLTTQRFSRLVEQESYRASDFLADLRKGIFGEIYESHVKIDPYRRNLQRSYLDIVSTRLNGTPRLTDDQRPLFRGELRTIAAEIPAARAKSADRETSLHLEDLQDQIARILDPKFQSTTAAPAPILVVPITAQNLE